MTNLPQETQFSDAQHAILKKILNTVPIYQPSLLVTGNNNLPTGIINPFTTDSNNHLTNPKQCANLTFSNTTD